MAPEAASDCKVAGWTPRNAAASFRSRDAAAGVGVMAKTQGARERQDTLNLLADLVKNAIPMPG
jgi:hypothetical protein